jgi:hypothetical protein
MNQAPHRHLVTAQEWAQELLKKHNVTATRSPVPVESIASHYGAIIQYTELLADGSLTPNDGRYIMRVNHTSHPYRRRFTIAHELGHILLAELDQQSRSRFCSINPFTGNQEERFCDSFAANLLIPGNAIRELTDWRLMSIKKMVRKAHECEVSLSPLVWRILEEATYEGGALWFRMMGKPADPQDIKLRLDWGVFPKSQRLYLPRFDSVPKTSPIYQATTFHGESIHEDVKLDFGSLRDRRTILVKAFPQAVLVIVFPKEFDYSTLNFSEQLAQDRLL